MEGGEEGGQGVGDGMKEDAVVGGGGGEGEGGRGLDDGMKEEDVIGGGGGVVIRVTV